MAGSIVLATGGGACSGGSKPRALATRAAGTVTPASTPVHMPAAGTATPADPAEGRGRPGGTLTLAASGIPSGFDPVAQNAALTSTFLSLACNGLLAPRNGTARFPDPADTTVIPDLAAALPEQPDALTYLFRLRPDARWQRVAPLNGRALVAADVKWQYDRAAGDPHSALRTDFGVIERVDAVDDGTVRILLKAPYAPFPVLLAGGFNRFILPRELGEAGTLRGTLIGTGPFVLAAHDPNTRALFRRNPDYARTDDAGTALPYLDEVEWLDLRDANARMQAYQSRRAGITTPLLPDEQVQLLAGSRNDYSFQDVPGVSNDLYMRLDQPPFDDARVRQALSLALDREAMIKTLGKGQGATDLPVPAFLRELAARPEQLGEAGKLYARDVQGARQLLAAAGHPEGFSTTISYTAQYGDQFVQALQMVRGFLREIGVDATPVPQEYARYLASTFRGDFSGLAYGRRDVFPDADPYLAYYYLPGGLYAQDHLDDRNLQALVERQRQTLDHNARVALLTEIQRYLSTAMYRVYDVAIGHGLAWQRAVKNYRGTLWPSYGELAVTWLQQ